MGMRCPSSFSAFIAFFWALSAFGQGDFAPKVDYVTGSSPSSVFASDLDGDGDFDLAVANPNGVSVSKNNGDGTFTAKVDYWAGSDPFSVFASDIDGDGDRDLAVANGGSSSVSILKNNGDGTFAAKIDYGTGNFPHSVFVSDLDGDGDQDLATANYASNTVSVLKNNGDGTFAAKVDYGTGSGPWSVFASDLDRDGDQDLAVANVNSTTVSVLENLSIIIKPPFCQGFSGLFCDDFESGASVLWTTTQGMCTWSVTGGVYTTSLTGNQLSCVKSVSNTGWRNYIFEYQVKGNAGVDKIVRFRQKDPDTYYFVNIRSDWQGQDEVILGKQAGGTETILSTVQYPSQNGVWYSAKITCVDEHITVSIGGNQIISVDDNANPIYYGGIGLVCFTGGAGICDISFDNVKATDPYPHILINEPSSNFYVGDYVTLTGRMQYRDGTPYIPISGNIGVEDPVSAFSAIVPVSGSGTFSYTTVNPSSQAGMWMFIFGSNTGEGVVRQAYNVPVSRSIPTQTLKSSRTFQAPTGTLNRPLQKTADAFSGRNVVQPFRPPVSILSDAVEAMWNSLKADAVTSWKKTIGSGVNRQMLQNAEFFAQKCNPLNPLDGNCANLTASYGYLFTVTITNAVWPKLKEGAVILHDGGIIDDCQHSKWIAAVDAAEVIAAFIGFDYGKALDVVKALAEGASIGTVLESIENSYQTCVGNAPPNPYPFAAATFVPQVGDILLLGLIPKIPRAVVVNGYSPIDITVTDPQGRYINKDTSTIPGAQYIQIDTDLDGDSEQIVIVPLDTIGDVQISVLPAPGALPTDTFSLVANYTYYEQPVVLASGLPISEIPPSPYQVDAYENLPPHDFNLVTPDSIQFSGFPIILTWNATVDPNPGHSVAYDVLISSDSMFSDTFVTYDLNDTSIVVDTLPQDTTYYNYYWKVRAHDLWGALSWSIQTRLFQIGCVSKPGDANSSFTLTLADIISTVNYIFNKPGFPSCPSNSNLCWLSDLLCRGDWNGDANVTLSDVIRGVNYIFNKPGGPWAPLPSGACCLPVP